jgi:hypothetical protein
LVPGDRFQATFLDTSFVPTRELNFLCDDFQSHVPCFGQERLATGWASRQLGSALLTDVVSILTQKYGSRHVLHTDRALQSAQHVLPQTIVVVQLDEVI